MEQYSISIIICAYTENRWDDLVAAVESAQKQTLPPSEIIVVIDHNTALLERAQAHLAGVRVVENTQVRGLSGARNSGIALAKGQLIAFLDDDAVATSNWLMLLREEFAHPRVLGSGGVITPVWAEKKPGWLPEEFYWVVGCTYRGLPQSIEAVRNPIGANMIFRREVFDAVGGFRSEIGRVGTRPIGCEETELCIRIRQHSPGGIFLYHPQAAVFHHVPGKRTSWRYFCSRCYAEGLSKAVVTHYVGVQDSLSSERAYTFRTLPMGVIQGVMDGIFRLDPAGFLRAGAIVAGLMFTVTGYLRGTLSRSTVGGGEKRTDAQPNFKQSPDTNA